MGCCGGHDSNQASWSVHREVLDGYTAGKMTTRTRIMLGTTHEPGHETKRSKEQHYLLPMPTRMKTPSNVRAYPGLSSSLAHHFQLPYSLKQQTTPPLIKTAPVRCSEAIRNDRHSRLLHHHLHLLMQGKPLWGPHTISPYILDCSSGEASLTRRGSVEDCHRGTSRSTSIRRRENV